MIKVNPSNCPEDHVCPMIVRCPKKAISQIDLKAPSVDIKKCIECMFCVNHCPHKCFEKH